MKHFCLGLFVGLCVSWIGSGLIVVGMLVGIGIVIAGQQSPEYWQEKWSNAKQWLSNN